MLATVAIVVPSLKLFAGRYHLRVFTVDERFSSVEVAQGRDHIDDRAAAVILEQFFHEAVTLAE